MSNTCDVHESPAGSMILPKLPASVLSALRYYQPFQIIDASDDRGPKVRIFASSVAGQVPSGFSSGDDPPYILTVSDGDVIYAQIDYSDSDGSVGGVSIQADSSIPTASAGHYYVQIGSVSVSGGSVLPTNYRYGPINVTLCRNWYAGEAPFYGVNIT